MKSVVTTLQHALALAPPQPPCFFDQREWAAYLLLCEQTSKSDKDRPFTPQGAFRPSFNFCADCLPDNKAQKLKAGKCNPDTFRMIVKEAA